MEQEEMAESYSASNPVPVAQLAQLVDILAALQSVIAGGRIKTDGEFTIEQLGELVIEQVKLKDSAGTVIDPAQSSDVAAVAAAIVGTGLPIPLALADPGNDDWSVALDPNPVTRACTRLRMYVGNSGMQLSLDGGTTCVSLPQNTGDDIGIAIPSEADVRIKRLTAGTAMTSIIVEVR